MNGPANNKSTITAVTITVAILAGLCVSTICYMSYCSLLIPPELNTLAGTLCGYLTGVLSKTAPTETTIQPAHPIVPAGGAPTEVKVVNVPTDPVPTTEEAK